MTGNEYQKKAMRTASANKTKSWIMIGYKQLLLNGVMGLNGEAGECIDVVKKHLFQGHDLDRDKLIDELSDVMWYVAITAQGLGVSLDEIMQHNDDKLLKRYPNGFEAEKSINRSE